MKCLASKNGMKIVVAMGKYRGTKGTMAKPKSVRGMEAAS